MKSSSSGSIKIPTLNLSKLNDKNDEEAEWFEESSEVLGNSFSEPRVGSMNQSSSFMEEGGLHLRGENVVQLQRVLEMREFELMKSIEYGQSLLTRIKFLDSQLEKERAEKERLEKSLDLVEEENVALKHRMESLELVGIAEKGYLVPYY
ncbi:hypothetical protein FDP41_007194 [Naegleria fowleri]|uniref:Uncharacterized protein n=1 Tax=Naegleria fowleri TaxID=5763 RepID=A0A6A5B8V4_NAEFO|nr:uncharacterized protein FDP41_007194 [Naegleria fowleri]KAF0973807.1 hypothetical protein FDP41_007194 [Naegleria fowleri]